MQVRSKLYRSVLWISARLTHWITPRGEYRPNFEKSTPLRVIMARSVIDTRILRDDQACSIEACLWSERLPWNHWWATTYSKLDWQTKIRHNRLNKACSTSWIWLAQKGFWKRSKCQLAANQFLKVRHRLNHQRACHANKRESTSTKVWQLSAESLRCW